MQLSDSAIKTPIVNGIYTISMTEGTENTTALIEANIVRHLLDICTSSKRHIIKYALKAIDNIVTTGSLKVDSS